MGAVISALRDTCAECLGRQESRHDHLLQEVRSLREGMGPEGKVRRELRLCC